MTFVIAFAIIGLVAASLSQAKQENLTKEST